MFLFVQEKKDVFKNLCNYQIHGKISTFESYRNSNAFLTFKTLQMKEKISTYF